MNSSRTLSQLQADWNNLHDLDRAAAVRALHKPDLSVRQIAKQLEKSESGLRRLLIALDAPAEDQALAKKGVISINELVRRSLAASDIAAAEKKEQQSIKAADRICKWLVQTKLNGPSCEMIVDEVRLRFFGFRGEPKIASAFPRRTAIAKIIEHSRPPKLIDDSMNDIAWFARWLLLWSYYAYLDPDIRDRALDIALERTSNM